MYTLLSTAFVIGAVAIVLLMGIIAINPEVAFNPLPPPSSTPTPTLVILPEIEVPAVVIVTQELPPTWTPLPTASPWPTATPLSTQTLTPTQTPTNTPAPATDVPGLPTATLAAFPFTSQAIRYAKHSGSEGCGWMSIAGAVFDINGKPLTRVGVEVRGENFEQFAWAGATTKFGTSGYEVYLNPTPIEATYTIRLLNYDVRPLSATVTITTRSSCDQNVTLVNFIQNFEYAP